MTAGSLVTQHCKNNLTQCSFPIVCSPFMYGPYQTFTSPCVPLSVSPIEPAVKFQSFQEQWDALTSEERSKRCLSDKEVCRSHGEHTDVQQHYLQTCFVSVFCLSGGSWHANHFPLPDLRLGYEITVYTYSIPCKVVLCAMARDDKKTMISLSGVRSSSDQSPVTEYQLNRFS